MSNFTKFKKNIENNLQDNLQIILLFLFSVHFGGIEEKLLWIWGIAGVAFFVKKYKKIRIDFHSVLLFLILLIYSTVYKYHFTESKSYTWGQMIQMLILPILMYFLCRLIVYQKKESYIEKLLWAIAGGTFLYSLLNYTVYLNEGFPNYERAWGDFWSQEYLYATQHSYWGVFAAALVGYAFCCLFEKKWIKSFLALLSVIISNYINLVVGNRMVLMTTIVATGLCMVMFLIINWNDSRTIRSSIFAFLITIVILLISVTLSWEVLAESPYYLRIMTFMSRDGGILHNIRFQMAAETLRQLPEYPFGGGYIHPLGAPGAHNYWLQAANDTGIVTLILWTVYIILVIVDAVHLLWQKQVEKRIKYMLVSMIGASGAYLMMEIGGGGMIDYIIFFVMLSAILHQKVRDARENGREKKYVGDYNRNAAS